MINSTFFLILRVKYKQEHKNITEMGGKMEGYFDDDGYEINPELIKKPSLCVICVNNDNPKEEILCNLTRHDQKDENEFKCFAFIKK